MGRFLGLKIAGRYLFSKKTHHAVNIITGVAVITTAIATAAIVIVLSVFNGFRQLATGRFSRFDPPLEIVRTDRQPFNADSLVSALSQVEGIGKMVPVIESKAFATTSNSQSTIRLIGTDNKFLKLSDIEQLIIDGTAFIGDTEGYSWGVVSAGTAVRLNLRYDYEPVLNIMIPKKKGRINPGSLLTAFRSDSLYVSGIFRIGEQSIDEDMVIVPLETATYLTGMGDGEATSLNLYPASNLDSRNLYIKLREGGFMALHIEQQNPDSYRMIQIEKWISFALLAFILVIASFNIISTLTMLIIEKRDNMKLLNAIGYPLKRIKSIFVWEGFLLSFLGGVAGCIIGAFLVLGQQAFGWVRLSADIDPSLLAVNVYPVKLLASDFFVVLGLVIILSVITTLVSVFTFSNKNNTKMIKNLIIGGLSIAFLAWVMAACSADGRKKSAGRNKPVIAVSIPPQLFFIDNIAGDKVETFCLLQSNADPESFEPSPTQRIELTNSDVYIPLGTLPFEKSLLLSLEEERNGLMIAEASEGITPLKDSHSHTHTDGRHHDEGEADPHVWSSPRNAKTIALNTLNALIAADSANEDYYRANYARLEARLDSIDQTFENMFSKMESRPSFIVWHPSLSYFANDYGLKQISLSDGGKEASVKGIIDRLKKAGETDAPICFYQKEFDAGKAEVLSSAVNAKIVEINPMNREWEDEIQKLYDAFTLN